MDINSFYKKVLDAFKNKIKENQKKRRDKGMTL